MDDIRRTTLSREQQDETAEPENERAERSGLSRRQLLVAGAGAAGAGLVGSRATKAEAATASGARSGDIPAPATQISMSVLATTQGQLKGDGAHTKLMTVFASAFDVSLPFDPSTGQVEGGKQFAPLTVTKPVGPGSPQLLTAASRQEVLKQVQITFFKSDPRGSTRSYYRITLTNATIVAVKQYVSDTEAQHFVAFKGLKLLEDVSFVFQQVEIEDLDGSTVYDDSWSLAP
ncbi:MAG TPA: type VI secretion system tube protein TssD [Chloroflexota bacterium]|nr:type VI secretion system tube protein TssD [Chloroflexota bacterium]